MIKGKQPEEIRKLFNIVNDFTPEEEVRSAFSLAFVLANSLLYRLKSRRRTSGQRTGRRLIVAQIPSILPVKQNLAQSGPMYRAFYNRSFSFSVSFRDVCRVDLVRTQLNVNRIRSPVSISFGQARRPGLFQFIKHQSIPSIYLESTYDGQVCSSIRCDAECLWLGRGRGLVILELVHGWICWLSRCHTTI